MSCDSSISTDVNGDQENIQPDFPEQMVDSTPGSNQVAGLGPCNKAAGLFLLTLKEKHRLTQAAVDFTLSQVKQLTKYVVEDVQSSVFKAVLIFLICQVALLKSTLLKGLRQNTSSQNFIGSTSV